MGHNQSKNALGRREKENALNRFAYDHADPAVKRQVDDISESGGRLKLSRSGNAGVRQRDEAIDAPQLARESVIKIFVFMSNPDKKMPWQTQDVLAASGSGVVVLVGGQKAILTAAHVVGATPTYIECQQATFPDKVECEIISVCHDCDLALIKPKNENFLNKIDPIKVAPMPTLRERIYVVGYPIGGDELSATEGVVSRIEVQPYAHSLRFLLAVTVDAAINAGNSGGPVLTADNLLAGIAFQAQEDAENIGHIIPPVIIEQFIQGVEKFGAEYAGFPALGITVQTMENSNLREFLGMGPEDSGSLISKTTPNGSGDGVWKAGDVLLEIDGHKVANNGTVNLNGIRCSLAAVIQNHYVGDKVSVKLWREKALVESEITLQPLLELCPTILFEKRPEYLVHCGLLFQPLSVDLLEDYFQSALLAPNDLLYMCSGYRDPQNLVTQVVVLTRVFKDSINIGYEEEEFSWIEKVNGKQVTSLLGLSEILKEAKKGDEPLRIETGAKALVILPNPSQSKAVHKSIMKKYNITSDHFFKGHK